MKNLEFQELSMVELEEVNGGGIDFLYELFTGRSLAGDLRKLGKWYLEETGEYWGGNAPSSPLR
ncbi:MULTISPECIES: hypothetical protein [Proteiniphilum]|jgi:hypothetical protein|uniref:hypothetical protein n=1 Tax=Proteiniphilum TaxID=294702 RepID=UPI001EE9E2E2|nr:MULTISPECIES: hypothetical protein [Proteiniphilum]ULB33603.1 hypothetical protein KDN43_11350 [Proteiniphilum propionicum]